MWRPGGEAKVPGGGGQVVAEWSQGRQTTVGRVAATEGLVALIREGHELASALHPAMLPMLVRPLPWTSPTDGGYLKSDVHVMRIHGDTAQVRCITAPEQSRHTAQVLCASRAGTLPRCAGPACRLQ